MSCLFHKWDGCRCTRCGKTRDDQHNWKWIVSSNNQCYQVCSVCGKAGEKSNHCWQSVPGTCEEKCSRCGTVREAHHFAAISGVCKERCTSCGKIRKIEHVFEWNGCRGTCTRCGYQTHKWNQVTGFYDGIPRYGCKCTVCGEINRFGTHSWETIGQTGTEITKRCTICGKTDIFHEMPKSQKRERTMDEELIYQDSLHDMRAHGIKC